MNILGRVEGGSPTVSEPASTNEFGGQQASSHSVPRLLMRKSLVSHHSGSPHSVLLPSLTLILDGRFNSTTNRIQLVYCVSDFICSVDLSAV